MEEHVEKLNKWKNLRPPFEAERTRSNTLPGLQPSNEQSCHTSQYNDSCNLKPICKLYRSNEELSMSFQDRMWKVNNDCMNTWTFLSNNSDMKNLDLNWSMQCNKGSPIITPIKDQLERMKIEDESMSQLTKESANQPTEESANQPTEESANQLEEESANQSESVTAIKSIIFSKKTRLHPKLEKRSSKTKLEISARQKPEKRHGSINEDNITPLKKLKNFQDMLDLRSNVPCTARSRIASDSRKALQVKYSPKVIKSSCTCTMIVLLLSIIVVLISIYLHETQQIRKHSNDFASAVDELKKRIHGQNQAVQHLCEYLQRDTPFFKVIGLIGGTGVGKSYTVDIIRKNFPRKYAIRQYFPPIKDVLNINLPLLSPNLIILENLREHDLTDTINFLAARQDKDRLVTVLAVFNFDYLNDSRDQMHDMFIINNSFLNQNIQIEMISYESLSEETLEMCIRDAIEESKLTLNRRQFLSVKEILLMNEAGCKGAYRQVQLIGRQ